jgi:hypothetical protein
LANSESRRRKESPFPENEEIEKIFRDIQVIGFARDIEMLLCAEWKGTIWQQEE